MVLGFTGLAANTFIGVLSIVLLVFGAEKVVEKMEGVAKYFGVSEVVVAMTVVAVGTSLPELALHVIGSANILASTGNPVGLLAADPSGFFLGSHSAVAHAAGRATANATRLYLETSGTVLGANIGSDVVQQTMVLGLVIFSSAVLAERHSFRFSRKFLIRDYAPMIGTTFMTLVLALNWRGVVNFLSGAPLNVSGTLTRIDGLVLLGSFGAYMYYLYTTRGEELASQGDAAASNRPYTDLFIGVGAMVAVIVSAQVFLRVVELAVRETGLSGSMIGVASVGVVSAFPEMITAVSALRQGSEGISLGTLIGSNITNPLLAIGSGALISTYAVPRPLVLWDLPMETVTAGILLGYLFSKERAGELLSRPFRWAGLGSTAEKLESSRNRVLSLTGALVLVALYFIYIYVRFKYFSHDFGVIG